MKPNKTISVTVGDIQTVTTELKALREKTALVQPRTPEQREQAMKLGPKTVQLIGKRLEAARQHRDALPPAFHFEQFEQQAGALLNLEECRVTLETLLQDIRDAMQLHGPAALDGAKSVLAHLQAVSTGAGQMHATVQGLTTRSRAGRKKPSITPAAQPPPGTPAPPTAAAPAPSAPAALPALTSPGSEQNKAA